MPGERHLIVRILSIPCPAKTPDSILESLDHEGLALSPFTAIYFMISVVQSRQEMGTERLCDYPTSFFVAKMLDFVKYLRYNTLIGQDNMLVVGLR